MPNAAVRQADSTRGQRTGRNSLARNNLRIFCCSLTNFFDYKGEHNSRRL